MLDLLAILGLLNRLRKSEQSDAELQDRPHNPFLSLFSNSLIAAGLSCLGLVIYPHHIITDNNLFLLAISCGPIIFGYWTRDTNERKIAFNRFWFGYSFALVFGLMRCFLFLYE